MTTMTVNGMPAMQWTGDNLKQLTDFTGLHERFSEWFSNWEAYEKHVKSSGDIFRIFYNGGGRVDAYVGTWIVKEPTGYLRTYSDKAFRERYIN